MMKNTSDKTPPIDKIKSLDGSIVIPIWRNETAEGKISYSVSEAERTYYDKQEGQYKTTKTIFDHDVLEVSRMYSRAYDRMWELREADYQQRKAANQERSHDDQLAA
jgi:hypothetical protein